MSETRSTLRQNAANIEVARPTQWSTFGVAVFDQHTTSEAIEAAGLDWEVALEPVHQLKKNGEYSPIPKWFGVTRQDNELVLGKVTERYEPFQNLEAFTFFDPILESGLARLDACDELYDGRVIWLVAKFQEPITIAGMDEEQIDMYCLLRTSHDGSKAISIDITPTRLRCSNTLNLALRESKRSWKVNHTASMREKLAEAQNVVANLGAYTLEFQATAEQLLSIDLTMEGFESIVKALHPVDSAAAHRQKLVAHHATTSTLTDEVRNTGWGAVNSVGEFYQHVSHYRSGDRALDQDWSGRSYKARNRVAQLLLNR